MDVFIMAVLIVAVLIQFIIIAILWKVLHSFIRHIKKKYIITDQDKAELAEFMKQWHLD